MTIPEFAAFMEGFAAFHSAGTDQPPSDADYLAVLAQEQAAGRA